MRTVDGVDSRRHLVQGAILVAVQSDAGKPVHSARRRLERDQNLSLQLAAGVVQLLTRQSLPCKKGQFLIQRLARILRGLGPGPDVGADVARLRIEPVEAVHGVGEAARFPDSLEEP